MYIYCEPFMFDLHQRIYLFSGPTNMREIAIASMEELGSVIVAMCDKYNVKEVRLKMRLDDFATSLVEEIHETNSALYSRNDINVEVI